jgi:hypothetical protein
VLGFLVALTLTLALAFSATGEHATTQIIGSGATLDVEYFK